MRRMFWVAVTSPLFLLSAVARFVREERAARRAVKNRRAE